MRPSAASREAPGFVSTDTATVELPQVGIGSRVHIKYEMRVSKPLPMGINLAEYAELFVPMAIDVSIDVPPSVPLKVGQQGGVAITDTTQNGLRHITAHAEVRGVSYDDEEPHMVSPAQLRPTFFASTFPSYEAIGAWYRDRSAGKAAVTPEIAALAHRIVGGATGRDAARLIYDWVAGNVRYLAVYLGATDDWVPHDAATVLKNGYGDCKDHVVLMQALLAAVGVRSAPALVDWDNRFVPLPIATPDNFNHTIIYLPDFDLFANPTSEYTPFGALDADLSGKLVVVAGDPVAVRQTPAAVPSDNRFAYTAEMSLGADGSLVGTSEATMSRNVEIAERSEFGERDSLDVMMRAELGSTREGGFGHLSITDPRDLDRPFTIRTRWQSPRAVPRDATAFTLPVGPSFAPIGNLWGYLTPNGTRRFPLDLGARDLVSDLAIRLPPGKSLTALPPAVSVTNPVGRYEAHYRLDDPTLIVHRELVFARQVVEPAHFADVEALIYAVLDDQRAILTTTSTAGQ
ncbi:transglutaminase domain-containing protein [Segnochrobactrum spirostomi]|uniref:Transglutaminase-like domain-containing protein n=1 Tax=Segnochrobactrum spirostomi TaxID=2608987 RepID=A0A6A7Y420_9HYPH|nr:transglutaminase domain-containing protein [Segnochrobactrum spirostomi]MQT13127.1 hypothetical protein [Segnochrobactrum spirostomi]